MRSLAKGESPIGVEAVFGVINGVVNRDAGKAVGGAGRRWIRGEVVDTRGAGDLQIGGALDADGLQFDGEGTIEVEGRVFESGLRSFFADDEGCEVVIVDLPGSFDAIVLECASALAVECDYGVARVSLRGSLSEGVGKAGREDNGQKHGRFECTPHCGLREPDVHWRLHSQGTVYPSCGGCRADGSAHLRRGRMDL